MAIRNRLRGQKVSFIVDTEERKYEVDSVVLAHVASEDDFVSFGDAEDGGAFEYRLTVRAHQSVDPLSFHGFLRENKGTEVDFVFAPEGNAVPSTSQPHVTGTIKLGFGLPEIGGEASVDGSTWTFEMEFKVVGDVEWISTAA